MSALCVSAVGEYWRVQSPIAYDVHMARRQEQESARSEVTEVAPNILRMELPIRIPGLGHSTEPATGQSPAAYMGLWSGHISRSWTIRRHVGRNAVKHQGERCEVHQIDRPIPIEV